MKLQRHKMPGRAVLVRVAPALTGVAGLLALSVRAAAAEGPSAARQVPAPAGVVRLINEYLAAKSAYSPDRTMSFFDRGNTTYVDATLGWKFPTWDSLKALFSKYMPQWPAEVDAGHQRLILGGVGEDSACDVSAHGFLLTERNVGDVDGDRGRGRGRVQDRGPVGVRT